MRKDEKNFKQISLLPKKQRREIFILKIMKIIVTFTSLVLVVSAIFFVATPLLNLAKNEEISKIDVKIAGILDEIKGMQTYEEVYNNNRSFIEILTKAMGSVPEWDKILNFLYESKPLTIQIQSVDQVKDKNIPSVTPNANANAADSNQTSTNKTLLIKCLVTDLNDFDVWLETLKKSNSTFAGMSTGTYTGNQYGYIVEISLPVPEGGPYNLDKGVYNK